MALAARPMHIPAGLPLDEAIRPELLDVGKANVSNVNVRQDERGALRKRLGFGSQSRNRIGGLRTAGGRLFSHEGVPCVIDGAHLDSFVERANTNVTRSRVSECAYRLMGVPVSAASSLITDTEHCAGFVAVASVPDFFGSGCVVVLDAATGAIVRGPEVLASGPCVLASFGGRYLVAVTIESSTEI